MPDAAPPPDSPPALDRDLYCLTCGYNLRGLSGDPLRCPECGHLNPIGDVEMPAEIISAQIRKMESAPAHCLGAVVLGVPLQYLFWAIVTAGFRRPGFPSGDIFILAAFAFAPVLLWITGAIRFRASCLGRPGWFGALLWYHLWGFILLVSTIGGVAGFIYVIVRNSTRVLPALPQADLLAFVAGVAACIPIVWWWVPRIYRLATDPLTPLQREVAVKIAREDVRKRLARQQRSLFQ